MAYVSRHPLFRDLTDEEEAEFIRHAESSMPPDLGNWSIYHPVCRARWLEIADGVERMIRAVPPSE